MYLNKFEFRTGGSSRNYSSQLGRPSASISSSNHTSFATSIEGYRCGLVDLLHLRNMDVLMSMARVLLSYSECHLRTMTVDALEGMVRSSITTCSELLHLSKAFDAAVACVPRVNGVLRVNVGLLSSDTRALLSHRPSLNFLERSLSTSFPHGSQLDRHGPVSRQGIFASAARARQPSSIEISVEEPKVKLKGPSLRMSGLSL